MVTTPHKDMLFISGPPWSGAVCPPLISVLSLNVYLSTFTVQKYASCTWSLRTFEEHQQSNECCIHRGLWTEHGTLSLALVAPLTKHFQKEHHVHAEYLLEYANYVCVSFWFYLSSPHLTCFINSMLCVLLPNDSLIHDCCLSKLFIVFLSMQ